MRYRMIYIRIELSGAPELNRESRVIRERSRRCERGRNPVKPLSCSSRDGKVRRVGRSVSQKTCLMEIGGKTYVVKGGSGNVGDHLAASDFINKLGLKGVMAPSARTLDATERSIIAEVMPKDNADAQELAVRVRLSDQCLDFLAHHAADRRQKRPLVGVW